VADELLIVLDPERRTGAKVKDSLRAVGFPLRVLAREHVDSVRERKRLLLIISEIDKP